ncbi:MAG TPA: superoxide dismutase [Verrucomicrobiales bacterium]|jgi:Fe-Mn family superoxide dismutase|nr:superoxide dismutase [Verrucomicrobiales bacterium]
MQKPATSTRRHFIATASAAVAATAVAANAQEKPAAAAPAPAPAGPFKLAPLPYAADALEPHIDAATMGIHHDKHHQAYVDNLNKALASHADLQKRTLEALIGEIKFLPEDLQKPIQNNGGGHWNHMLFWSLMAKPGAGVGGTPTGSLAAAIDASFGSFAKFQEKFADAAMKRFGSGWAWLITKGDGKVAVVSTANQDNPLMQGIVPNADRGTPVLALDVWEHAYYLKYQNKRADYIKSWWNVVNWPAATTLFESAAKGK